MVGGAAVGFTVVVTGDGNAVVVDAEVVVGFVVVEVVVVAAVVDVVVLADVVVTVVGGVAVVDVGFSVVVVLVSEGGFTSVTGTGAGTPSITGSEELREFEDLIFEESVENPS